MVSRGLRTCLAPRPGSEPERGLEAASTPAISWFLDFPDARGFEPRGSGVKRRAPFVRVAGDANRYTGQAGVFRAKIRLLTSAATEERKDRQQTRAIHLPCRVDT